MGWEALHPGNDDFMLWRLECMTDPVLRWVMVDFLTYCHQTRPYDWADPMNETGL